MQKKNYPYSKIHHPVPPSFVLQFSAEQKSFFPWIFEQSFDEKKADSLFQSLVQKSNPICKMIYGYEPFRKEAVAEFIRHIKISVREKNWFSSPVPLIIAGCFNFFEMNDIAPDKDFLLTEKLYPNIKKDCYSVGMLQPYIMNSILNCKSLTVIDISWPVLWGHWQIYQLLDKLDNADIDPDQFSEKIELHWPAVFFSKPLEKNKRQGIRKFCRKISETLCKEVIGSMRQNFFKLSEFILHASLLHHADYPVPKNSMPVIYLSNAIDPEYTSWKDFQKLIQKVNDALPDDGQAVFIYHVGGGEGFALYELNKKKNGSQKIKTICRDKFLPSKLLKVSGELNTWFEKISKNNPGTCSKLFLKLRKS